MSTVGNSWNNGSPETCHRWGRMIVISHQRTRAGRKFRRIVIQATGPSPPRTIDRANELLDTGAIGKRGVRTAQRPQIFHCPAAPGDFHTDSQFGCMPARRFVDRWVGNPEATMSYRCRGSNIADAPDAKILGRDPNFRHEAAPKPRRTNEDYHPDYLSDKIGGKTASGRSKKFFVTTDAERYSTPQMFCVLARIYGATRVHHKPKDEWIRRHFPNHRVHA